ncbi:hypothetical protein [Dyadobacter diqingensis]|uniref:hypothetical protein n=1 Tax=Dyadobacter diqingensis TaxID=2938121 RepID=UPI0020C1A816|nr:hypothetical protein [Dyadobacter diqingensis]
MIVWSGFGFLTPIICVLCILLGNSVIPGIPYHLSIAFILAAVINWFAGKKVNGGRSRVLKDEQTGEVFELKHRSTFFWLAMEWWSVALIVFAAIEFFH